MTAEDDLSCKEFVEIVTEYLEGCLPAEERARFEAHLQGCGGCRTYLDQIQQTIRAVGALSEQDLSPQAQQTLLNAFRDWKRGREG